MLTEVGDVKSVEGMSARGMQPQQMNISNAAPQACVPSNCAAAMIAVLATGKLQSGLLRWVEFASLHRLPPSLSR
jgi:hypothetical protein